MNDEHAMTAKRPTDPENWLEPIRQRVLTVVGGASCAEVSRRTGFNAETVRRYMRRGPVSSAFIARVCEVWDVNSNWLLFGLGPQRGRERSSAGSREAGA